MANWPLILAGPILRRVTPNEVSVWVALREPRTVHLSVYQGLRVAHPPTAPVATGSALTTQFGPKLHIAVVTATAGSGLAPGTEYSYDVALGNGQDLQSEGLLVDDTAALLPKLALGYQPDWLPSFKTVPLALTELRLLHGSCRKTHGGGADALAWVDGLIQNAGTRPHQLFLTGDQIYADEIPVSVLDMILPIAKELMGGDELVPIEGEPTRAFNAANFPAGFRQDLMRQKAKFSTTQGHSHLVTFGEFAAMYLLSWSNVLWPEPGVNEQMWEALTSFDTVNAAVDRDQIETWPLLFHDGEGSEWATIFKEFLRTQSKSDFAKLARKDEIAEALFTEMKKGYAPKIKEELDRLMGLFRGQYGTWFKKDEHVRIEVARFFDALPQVRRALANVPVYMVADDHEVTDDWNVTAEWQQRVTSSPLGRTIERNAIANFVIFQAWGNVPSYWNTAGAGGGKDAIQDIAALFANGMPDAAIATKLDNTFGIAPAKHQCDLKFYFTAPGEAHEVIGLDTRTARGFDSRLSSPALLSPAAIEEQLPELPGDKQIRFVIAPGPVLSPAVIEEMVWPGLMRAWDTIHAAKTGLHLGYEEWDSEAWAFNPVGFENFIGRLAGWKKAIILSGDVHYAMAAEMDYFKKGDPQPSRIIQYTSSGLKNSFPEFAVTLIRSLSVTQQILRFGSKMQRLGWTSKSPAPLSIPVNQESDALNPHLRSKLKKEPVLIPAHGWPQNTTTAVAPDWSWRFSLVYDLRDDADRPDDTKPPVEPQINFDLNGYYQVALKHMEGLDMNTNKRSIHFDSNLGLVVFTAPADGLQAEQHLYSVSPDNIAGPPAVYAKQVSKLVPAAGAAPPTIEYIDVDFED